jgi:uncharacterized protein (TIGR02145 family)
MKTGDIFSGRYRLLEKIGVGGYAQVWKAVDMMADDAVLAIKIFAADNGLDADGLKQFRREYALVLNLNHANLLTARHFDVWEGRPYLIMPYIEHGSLASRLLREGPMNEAELIDLIRQLSEALAYLHENDILHQDIKPDNVLIGPKGRYLLMDFGISSRLKSTLRKSTGSVGTMTVAYGPPERFDAQPKQLPAGDVFSLGVLAYEMATGDVPWMGNGGMSLKIGAEIPDLPEWYSESFKRLFRRMLSLGPDSRPSSSEINKAIRQKSTGTESGSTKKNPRVTERITPESSSYRETHNEIQSDPIESRRKTNSASGLKLVIGLFVGFIAIVILINLGGNEPILPTEQSVVPISSGRDTQTAVVNVTNPATGRVWMDRNLGASRAATSSTDTQAYGDLYQWGRAADGHQKRTSSTTTTRSSTDQPGHANFITTSATPNDWRTPQNNNLWQGVNGINNPCPVGYRLPTNAEWVAERRSWSSSNAAGAFASPLKLPLAGYRLSSSGSLFIVGSFGVYWSSSVSGTYARSLNFNSINVVMSSNFRADGYSVRCLRD